MAGVKGRSGVPRTRAQLAAKVAAGKASAARRAFVAATRQKSATEQAREAADLRFAEARARQAERDDATAAGALMTKQQAAAVGVLVRDAFHAEGEQLPAAVAALLPKLSRGDRDQVEKAVREAWSAARARIARGIQP